MPNEGGANASISIVTLKTIFDVSWKVIPFLWLIFQLFNGQTVSSKQTDSNTSKIEALSSSFNALDRRMVELAAEARSLRDQMESDREFYLQTSGIPTKKRKINQ